MFILKNETQDKADQADDDCPDQCRPEPVHGEANAKTGANQPRQIKQSGVD